MLLLFFPALDVSLDLTNETAALLKEHIALIVCIRSHTLLRVGLRLDDRGSSLVCYTLLFMGATRREQRRHLGPVTE